MANTNFKVGDIVTTARTNESFDNGTAHMVFNVGGDEKVYDFRGRSFYVNDGIYDFIPWTRQADTQVPPARLRVDALDFLTDHVESNGNFPLDPAKMLREVYGMRIETVITNRVVPI